MYIQSQIFYLGFIPSSKRGRRKLIPQEIEESLIKRLVDDTPGKQLNYDEQIQLIMCASYKVYTLLPKEKRRKKPWKKPSRRSVQRYIKKFNLKPSTAQVETVARYCNIKVHCHLFFMFTIFIFRYESVRDHRNFISLFCALEGLREMFGYEDVKTGKKKFNWSNCLSFDESTGCTLLQYGSTRVLKQKKTQGTSDKPPSLVVKRYVHMYIRIVLIHNNCIIILLLNKSIRTRARTHNIRAQYTQHAYTARTHAQHTQHASTYDHAQDPPTETTIQHQFWL